MLKDRWIRLVIGLNALYLWVLVPVLVMRRQQGFFDVVTDHTYFGYLVSSLSYLAVYLVLVYSFGKLHEVVVDRHITETIEKVLRREKDKLIKPDCCPSDDQLVLYSLDEPCKDDLGQPLPLCTPKKDALHLLSHLRDEAFHVVYRKHLGVITGSMFLSLFTLIHLYRNALMVIPCFVFCFLQLYVLEDAHQQLESKSE